MSTKIHVVMGTAGAYSDRAEWAVCAYLSEQKAREHVTNAERRAGELYAAHTGHDEDDCADCVEDDDSEPLWRSRNEFDPTMKTDNYTGTRYRVVSVDLMDANVAVDAERARSSGTRLWHWRHADRSAAGHDQQGCPDAS